MKFQIDPRVAHLDAGDLTALIDRYYAGERVAGLIDEFQLHCVPNQVSRLLPPKVLHGQQCDACGAPLIQVSRSRPEAPTGRVHCSVCAHRVSGLCDCTVCTQRVRDLADREAMRRHAEKEAYCHARWSYLERVNTPHDLQLEEAAALLAVVRCGGWRTTGSIGAIGDSAVPLAPAGLLGEQLLSALISGGVIAPDVESPVAAFDADDKGLPAYPYVAFWRVLAPSPILLVEQIERLATSGTWPVTWCDALGGLQMTLALAECHEFADFCLSQRGVSDPPEVASEALFRNLLHDFSVAQCFRIIWAGAHATSDFLVRKRAHRRHAANYFIGACQRWADRARAEGRTISPGFRNNNYPRSQLSLVLYDVFLGIGEKGFVEPLDVGTT